MVEALASARTCFAVGAKVGKGARRPRRRPQRQGEGITFELSRIRRQRDDMNSESSMPTNVGSNDRALGGSRPKRYVEAGSVAARCTTRRSQSFVRSTCKVLPQAAHG